MKKLFLLLFSVTLLVSIAAPACAQEDIFAKYITKKPPSQVKELSSTPSNGGETITKEITFSSLDGKNTVFAYLVTPAQSGNYPAIVVFHGGNGCADSVKGRAEALAKEGYICIAPDLPGIADPAKCPKSEGAWKARGYNQDTHMQMNGKPQNSGIFEGEVAAIDAFYLLRSQPGVIQDKMGMIGTSWGGYTVTMLGGLLGNDIKAIYSEYGCAFYDEGSHWSKNVFPKYGEDNTKLWLTYLDAGIRIKNLTADYFIEAPTNDTYFWPSAVTKTVSSTGGHTNQVFTPNMNHQVYGTSNKYVAYFNHQLKGQGSAFPTVSEPVVSSQTDQGITVSFAASPANEIDSAEVYFADNTVDWNSKKWSMQEATKTSDGWQAVLPSYTLSPSMDVYALVRRADGVVASSLIVSKDGFTPTEDPNATYKVLDTIIIPLDGDGYSQSETVKDGVIPFTASGLKGYSGPSRYTSSLDAKAVYAPKLKEGTYRVSVFKIVHENSQPKTPVDVISKDGTQRFYMDYTKGTSGWEEVGFFNFAEGSGGQVIISKDPASTVPPLRVDAVQFELVEMKESVTPPKEKPVRPDDEVAVLLNDDYLSFPADQKPLIKEDRTLVPFRAIFEALSCTVSWEDATNTAIGIKDGVRIELPIGSTAAKVNGVPQALDVPAQLIGDRTYVPLRFIGESLGLNVTWEEATKTVIIKE